MKYILLIIMLLSGTAFGINTTISSTFSNGSVGVHEMRRTGWDNAPEDQKVYNFLSFLAGGSNPSTGVYDGGGYHYAVMVYKLPVSPPGEFFMDGASVSEFKFDRAYGSGDMPELNLRVVSVSDAYPQLEADKATYDYVLGGTIVARNFLSGASQISGGTVTETLEATELTSLTNAIKSGGYDGTQEKYLTLSISLHTIPTAGSYAGFRSDSFSMDLLTAVPEPATYALIMGSLVAAIILVNKRKKGKR